MQYMIRLDRTIGTRQMCERCYWRRMAVLIVPRLRRIAAAAGLTADALTNFGKACAS